MASDANEPGKLPPASAAEMPRVDRRGTHRRALILVTVTTLVAVVAGLTVWATRRVSQTDDISHGLPTSVPFRFDPGQQLIHLTFLPGTVRWARYETEPGMQSIMVSGQPPSDWNWQSGDPPKPVDRSWRVEVRMAAQDVDAHRWDREYDEEAGWTLPGDEIAPVRGRPAFTNEGQVLSWEYVRYSWIRITVHGVDRSAELALARQVAEGIRWETRPLALPFETAGLPEGAVLGSAVLEWSEDGPVRSSAGYLLEQKDHGGFIDPDFTVGLTTESLDSGTEAVTVSGRAATADVFSRKSSAGTYRVGQLPGGCAQCVAELDIPKRSAGATAVRDKKAALLLAASIRLVEGHEDPAKWRTW